MMNVRMMVWIANDELHTNSTWNSCGDDEEPALYTNDYDDSPSDLMTFRV